ncbi:hypothetical protein [Acinetobacter sp. WCHA29]|uniref:hypothetical protein n=1 Tax=Acinetobacter sp. WCHA29 TaxID=2004649 RepID=UPI001D0D8098|nr:hypothetical protein [Acinetobacter sp. WCHA29]
MLLKKSQLVKQNGNPFKIKGKNYEIFKRSYYILYILNVYSIRCNIKCKNEKNTQWGEESVQLATDKGLISIYALSLTKKQANHLDTLKKGSCVHIKAKDQTLEKYDGVISIMEFESAKTVKCK